MKTRSVSSRLCSAPRQQLAPIIPVLDTNFEVSFNKELTEVVRCALLPTLNPQCRHSEGPVAVKRARAAKVVELSAPTV